jgi:hypothetical protein
MDAWTFVLQVFKLKLTVARRSLLTLTKTAGVVGISISKEQFEAAWELGEERPSSPAGS